MKASKQEDKGLLEWTRATLPRSTTGKTAVKAVIAELKACSNTRNLGRGRNIHEAATECGNDSCIYVATELVKMYAKCGKMCDASRVFKSIQHPDVVLWTALIMGYAENGEGETALRTFARVRSLGFVPDSFTFVAALQACGSLARKAYSLKDGWKGDGRLECLKQGRVIHSQIGRQCNSHVRNSLIDMYAKCGSMSEAHQVFNSIKCPGVVPWTALISGYAENGEEFRALDLFARMKIQGCAPNAITFISVLKACASLSSKGGARQRSECLELGKQLHLEISFHSNIYVHSTLIDMYAKCGSMGDASLVFHSLKHPDLVLWNALIVGYVENGESLTALSLFTTMKSQGCSPDHITFAAALKACGLLGDFKTGKMIHEELKEGGEVKETLVTCLVDFYAKCGSLLEARRIFDSYAPRGLRTWSALLAAYSRVGDEKTVFELLESMQEAGLQPDVVTFISVLMCCSHAGLVEKAERVFQAMPTKYGIAPAVEHYNCMIDILGRSNKIYEAMELLRSMPCRPDAVTWMSVLGACNIWKNVGIGILAFRSHVTLNDGNTAAYVLMANIYGSRVTNGKPLSLGFMEAMALASVDKYVDLRSAADERERALSDVLLLLEQGQMSIQTILLHMDPYLTTTNELVRSRGMDLLVQLIARTEIPPNVVHLLAEFFIARLTDKPCAKEAAAGCLGLLQRCNVSKQNVFDLLQVLSTDLYVPTLPQQTREICLRTLDCILDKQSSVFASQMNVLFDAIRSSFEDEKDPRCLLIAFSLVKRAASLLPISDSPVLEAQLFFDSLCRYFPISFKPKPGCLESQEDLVKALQNAFVASPLFASECIPFLLDKLSSSLQAAKLQSLDTLGFCLPAYGANAVAGYAKSVWIALRGELYQESEDAKVFVAAKRCLTQCIKAFQHADEPPFSDGGHLLNLLLEDVVINDSLSHCSDARLWTTGQVVSAAASSSRSSAAVIASRFLDDVLASSSMNPLLMEALVALLCAARDVAKEHASKAVIAYDTKWLDPIYSHGDQLVDLFSQGVRTPPLLKASVRGLECLATYPGHLSILSRTAALELVSTLTAMLVESLEGGTDSGLPLGAVASICETEEAFEALGKSDLVEGIVVPSLLRLVRTSAKETEAKIAAVSTVAKQSRSVRDLLMNGILQDLDLSAQSEGALQCLSALLPLYNEGDGSKWPMLVAMKIWSSVEVLPSAGPQVVTSLMDIVRDSVSKCSTSEQEAILKAAFDVCKLREEAPWVAALWSSVAASSRPSILLHNLEVVDLLYDVAVAWDGSRNVIAEGLASVLNKWSATQPSLDDIIDHLLNKAEISALGTPGESELVLQAVDILVWMTKALAMRGHSKVPHIAAILLRLLMANVEDINILRASAKGFGALVEDARGLSKECFATERPLYKQRLFTSLLGPLLQGLKSKESRTWLLRGFSYLTVSVPQAVLFSEASTVFPVMLSALSALASDPQDAEILQATLLATASFILNENHRELVEDYTSAMLKRFTELTQYSHSWVVRRTSLQCLCAVAGLSYARIYPFKLQITKDLLKNALDDRKRAVRKEAVLCYQAWLNI